MAALMGQKIVVIGGSSGIGLGVAAAALKSGAHVLIVGRSPAKLQAAERTLGADRRVRSLAVDMTKEAEVARMFDEVGTFDHLVSTAGTPPPGDPIDHTDKMSCGASSTTSWLAPSCSRNMQCEP